VVVLIAGGIAVALLWYFIGSRLPLVDFSGIDVNADPWQDAIARPMLIRAVLIMASVDSLAVGLLMVGGIRMLRRPATTP